MPKAVADGMDDRRSGAARRRAVPLRPAQAGVCRTFGRRARVSSHASVRGGLIETLALLTRSGSADLSKRLRGTVAAGPVRRPS